MAKNKKKVVQKENPSANKNPKTIVDPDGYFKKNPVWAFGRCDMNHESWTLQASPDFYTEILDKLVSFERQTWADIQIRDKKKNHHIPMTDLCKDAQKRADEIHLHEDQLFSLRLEGDLRLFGVIDDGIFNIVWYDNCHEICPCLKKHT